MKRKLNRIARALFIFVSFFMVHVNGVAVSATPLASGAGHIAGGTASGLFKGESLNNAFGNSFDGLGQSMAIGTGIGVASTVGVSFANGINPINGRPFPVRTESLNQFNSYESLIDAAKSTFGKTLKHGELQGFIKGDANSIFKSLTNNGIKLPSGAVKMPDGTIINLYQSSSRGVMDLRIQTPSQVYKIRIN